MRANLVASNRQNWLRWLQRTPHVLVEVLLKEHPNLRLRILSWYSRDSFNMRASCRYTRRRFETTRGGVLDMSTGFFRAPNRATHHTFTHTPKPHAHHTEHQTQPHAHHTTRTPHPTDTHTHHQHNHMFTTTRQHDTTPHNYTYTHITQHHTTHHTPLHASVIFHLRLQRL